MTLFASFWWLWLCGLVVCAGFGVYKWLHGFWKTGGTIIKATTLTLEGVEVAFDEERNVSQKAAHARTRVFEEVAKEGAERFKGFVVGMAAFACAGLFGVLLILSVVFQFLK